jgi:basic amino acid/polyamine antiporter, APA family
VSQPAADQLPRTLGIGSAVAVLVGSTIGSGILRVPNAVAGSERPTSPS